MPKQVQYVNDTQSVSDVFINRLVFYHRESGKKEVLSLKCTERFGHSGAGKNPYLKNGLNHLLLNITKDSDAPKNITRHLKKDEAIILHVKIVVDSDSSVGNFNLKVESIEFSGYVYGVKLDGTDKPAPAIKKIKRVFKHLSIGAYGLSAIRTSFSKRVNHD